MKTFEERYTAWIDGRLDGAALAAFEQELAARADAREARGDRADAVRLRVLLQDHLQAPALGNGEFFSLQVRQRIDAERQAARRPEPVRRAWAALFAWPAGRLAGAGAACLFVAAALYYGLMPPHPASRSGAIARAAAPAPAGVAPGELADTKPVPAAERSAPAGNNLMVRNNVSPTPADIYGPAPDLAATVPNPAETNATATPLHHKQSNVNVLWIDGLDYMPTVPGADGAPSAADSPAAAAPRSSP